jgi:hypothetical protein
MGVGRYGGRTSEHAGARDFTDSKRMKDGDKIPYGSCVIHKDGGKHHVIGDGKRLNSFDSLAEAKKYIEDRAMHGGARRWKA